MKSSLATFADAASQWSELEKPMPAIFVGHGAPLYALGNNLYSETWKKIGESLPRPKAILSISAHWLTPGKTLVTASPKPKTIHDFGLMDKRLFEMQYPASGNPELAQKITEEVDMVSIQPDFDWGYDHGTWCVLYHMFPKADIPVLQMSIDYSKGGIFHFDLAKQLYFLRKRGVLIMGSGNIVHNLRQIIMQESVGHDWAIEFDKLAKKLIDRRDFKKLIDYQNLGSAAQLSIPTPDHYYPLLYVLGLMTYQDEITYPIEGISYGSASMRSVLVS